MFLSNFPKVRIKEYSKGFAVEIEKKRWYGKKYWMPIETVTGLSDTWYYETIEMAASEAKKHFEWCLFDGYRKY